MRRSILDCTLRDGGYVNEWKFGGKNIREIVHSLILSNIDIIELGYLTERNQNSQDSTLFNSILDINDLIPQMKNKSKFVVMMNFGGYDVENIPVNVENKLDGIRVAFHKENMTEALSICRKIKEKGYMVFVQPMVIPKYSDMELLKLIKEVNEIEVDALYIVDSFGSMNEYDVMRIFMLFEHNLKSNISIGFHSHNNLQLSFSNAQAILKNSNSNDIIIDSTILGMGRGAGNLNTELFIEYMNSNFDAKYKLIYILQIIDNILYPIYKLNYWGYSVPYYLSAKNKCHPNYAAYLSNKNTLDVQSINQILTEISSEKRTTYDEQYIRNLYISHQKHNTETIQENFSIIEDKIKDKKVVIIASGRSLRNRKKEIKKFINENHAFVISVNFIPKEIEVNAVFFSNIKRFENTDIYDFEKTNLVILTSNIITDNGGYVVIDYNSLLNENFVVADNSGLMLIKLLISLSVKEIYLAGFDGYDLNNENYLKEELEFIKSGKDIVKINKSIKEEIGKYNKKIKINFLTESKYK
ncbi:3-hydroxy-3-methylglutaryl-CoA lyase [uncultured Clostridium sp.]|uniref:3-hydroxy-3-methylglutaryl-CoA lyase n=1 Tax=uncultured Clostridium sp. TaxID=59620 RepID=UPI0025F6EF3E|nr:3-hydroxy-3-methylglutaryl-CoA lyase [uncultured Clostridium sp.]